MTGTSKINFSVLIWLIVLSFLIVLLHLLPVIFLKESVERTGEAFLIQQITHHGDSAIYYLPRAREIADGHFPVSDLSVPENKKGMPFIFPPGPQLLLGGLIAFIGDTQWAYVASTLIFPVIMFWLFFWLGQVLWQNALGSFLFSAIGVLTPVVSHIPKTFFGFQVFLDTVVKNFIPMVRTPILGSFLLRVEDPLLTLWLYILVLILLYIFWRQPSARKAALLGLAAGLLLYFYLLYWLFSVTLMALLFGYDLLGPRRIRLGQWLLIGLLVFIFSLPYIANFVELRALPQAGDLILRVGFEHGRGFRLSVWPHYLAYLLLGCFGFFLLKKKEPESFAFLAASLLAMAILWNMQLVTGWNIAVDHWPKAFALPYFMFSALLVSRGLRWADEYLQISWSRKIITAFFIFLILLLFAKKAVNAAVFLNPPKEWIAPFSFNSHAFPKKIFDSWLWLNQNAPPESNVLTNSFVTSVYLSGYTSMNPYLPHAQNTLLSTFDLEERFLVVHKLFGTPPAKLREFLSDYRRDPLGGCVSSCDPHSLWNRHKIPEYLYAHAFNIEQTAFDSLRPVPGYYVIPEKRIEELLERYQAMRPRWEDFRGSLVYYGPWERDFATVDLKMDAGLEILYDNGTVQIYRIR